MRFNLFVLVSLLLTSAAYAGEKPAGIPWKTETTPNFSIHYRHVHDIRAIATACEAARTRVHQFWFADDEIGGWAPRCNVYVCGDSEEFSLAGRASAGGAGQSLVVGDGKKVTYRKIVLRADDPRLFEDTLPHEVAHVVIGSHVDGEEIPLWLDEGMAAFAESNERQQSLLLLARKEIVKLTDHQLVSLLNRTRYPTNEFEIARYYAISHSIVAFLRTNGRHPIASEPHAPQPFSKQLTRRQIDVGQNLLCELQN